MAGKSAMKSPLVTWSLLRITTEALGSNAQVVASHVECKAEAL